MTFIIIYSTFWQPVSMAKKEFHWIGLETSFLNEHITINWMLWIHKEKSHIYCPVLKYKQCVNDGMKTRINNTSDNCRLLSVIKEICDYFIATKCYLDTCFWSFSWFSGDEYSNIPLFPSDHVGRSLFHHDLFQITLSKVLLLLLVPP